MLHKKNLNIVVVGKSGAGKSSLLNYLAEAETPIFEAGIGKPVTQAYFEEHSYTNPSNNITYRLYDTKGIEPGITDEFISEIEGKIEKFKESDDFFEHLHTLYYCLDASSKRIEPFEEKFIKKMSKSLDVVIVLTKIDLISATELEGFYATLKKDLNASEKDIDADIRITKVCSVAQRTRKGTSEKFGREDVLKHSFVGLWNTFSKNISGKIYDIAYYSVDNNFSIYDTPAHQIYVSHTKRYEFNKYWNDYFEVIKNFEKKLVLFHILRFPVLQAIDLENLDKGDKAILKLILIHCNLLLLKFNQYNFIIEDFQKSINMEAQKVLNFYSQITGKKNNSPISFNKSVKKLEEVKNFVITDLKDFLSQEIDFCISNIVLDDLKDGWFSNAATEEKERFTDIFDMFLYNLKQADESLQSHLKDFENICATELESYGRYVLDMTEVNADEIDYEREVRFALEDDGVIDSSERRFLERFKRTKTNLTEDQANEIENRVAKELESKKLNNLND